jgi:hypothetical protein
MDKEKEQQLRDRISQLEFENDQLSAELQYMDDLLRKVGFHQGLLSVKEAAKELASTLSPHERIYEDGLPDEPPGLED